jgi:hypothetical protein
LKGAFAEAIFFRPGKHGWDHVRTGMVLSISLFKVIEALFAWMKDYYVAVYDSHGCFYL